MGLDLKKIQSRLDSVKSNNKAGGSFWRPKDGQQVIRIVPTADGDPFKDYWFHYNLGDEQRSGVLCPKKNHGEECPICDFKDQLWKEYNATQDTDTLKMAKDMTPRQRFFSPVLVRTEEAEGIRIWGYGKEAYTSLLNLVLNPEYGDITDTDAGTDLTLTYGKPPGANFPKTTLTPRRRTSVLCDEAVGGDTECSRLLENIPNFEVLFPVKDLEEVQGILDSFMTSLQDTDTEETASIYEPSSSDTPSVLEAFNELRNN
jgi:hypothetical protein